MVACHAAIRNRESYYAIRFLLGMFEAGMFPGIMAQLTSWYRSDEMGKPVAWLFAIQQMTGVIGSLICYAISYMNGIAGLSAWRWWVLPFNSPREGIPTSLVFNTDTRVYLLEGLATILFSAVVFFVLPDYPKSPRSNKWLSKREQEFIEARLSDNAPLTNDPAFSEKEIIAALRSPHMWVFTLSQMLVNTGGYALNWYLPTITTSLGFATLPKNQLLNIPPAASGIVGIVIAAYFMSWSVLTRLAFIM